MFIYTSTRLLQSMLHTYPEHIIEILGFLSIIDELIDCLIIIQIGKLLIIELLPIDNYLTIMNQYY